MGAQSPSQSKGKLFDVFDNFNQELAKARRESGEPEGGIERVVWEAQKKVESSGRSLGLGLLAVAGILGAVFAFRYARDRLGEVPESVPVSGKEAGENPAA